MVLVGKDEGASDLWDRRLSRGREDSWDLVLCRDGSKNRFLGEGPYGRGLETPHFRRNSKSTVRLQGRDL